MNNQIDKATDWTGALIQVPEQHCLIITGPWKQPGWWWWKCNKCTKSSGVMNTTELQKLDSKGVITFKPNVKLPSEYSGHPKESDSVDDDEMMYGYGYW